MIADALANKRIAITGSTGFVGTALVERLLRQVPDCELVLLVRSGRRVSAAQRVKREILRNDAFARLRAELGGAGFDEMTAPRALDRRGRRHGRPGPRRGRPGHAGELRHRHPLGGDGGLRLPAGQCGRGQSAGAEPHRDPPAGARRRSSRRRRVHLLRRREPAWSCAGGSGGGRAVRHRPELEGGGGRRPPAALRRRGGEPPPGDAGPLPVGGPVRAGRRGRPGAGREDRAATRAVGHGPSDRGRPVASGERRLARRLCLHQGARRAGPSREQGRRAGVDRSAVDHRVRTRRAAAGLDPRLPHGRARHHLVRPRALEGVPGRPRGHGRRHPCRPGGGGDHRRRRGWSRPRRPDHAGGLRLRQPPEVPRDGRQHDRLVPRAPALRRRRSAHRRARLELPRPRTRAGPAQPGQGRAHQDREGAAGAPSARAAGGVVGPAGGEAAGGRAGTGVRRALRALAECEAIYGVDNLLALADSLPPEDRSAFNFDPRVIDWPRYITEVHLPSVIEHARVKTTPGKTRIDPPSACAATFSPPTAMWPRSTSRTRSSPATWSRATPGWRRDGSTGPSGPASPCGPRPRSRACSRWIARTAATSSASSTGATRTRQWSSSTRTPSSSSPPSS